MGRRGAAPRSMSWQGAVSFVTLNDCIVRAALVLKPHRLGAQQRTIRSGRTRASGALTSCMAWSRTVWECPRIESKVPLKRCCALGRAICVLNMQDHLLVPLVAPAGRLHAATCRLPLPPRRSRACAHWSLTWKTSHPVTSAASAAAPAAAAAEAARLACCSALSRRCSPTSPTIYTRQSPSSPVGSLRCTTRRRVRSACCVSCCAGWHAPRRRCR